MGYTISGQLLDSRNKPIEFATVYTSDSIGKPVVGAKTTQTDENGKWILNGVNDSDYITVRLVGFDKKTISAKSIVPINIMGVPTRLVKINLNEDVKTILEETPIVSKRVIKKENKLGKYIAIASVAVALISTTILFFNKKLN